MKLRIVLASVTFHALVFSHSCFTQDVKKKSAKEANRIYGPWVELCFENQGKLVSPRPSDNPNAKPEDPKVERIWKVAEDKLEMGRDDKTFPTERWSCKFDHDKTPGIIDAVLVEKDGKQKPDKKLKGIYQLKDDYLLVCINIDDPPVRPEKFTTTGKSSGTFLFILRRGKQK